MLIIIWEALIITSNWSLNAYRLIIFYLSFCIRVKIITRRYCKDRSINQGSYRGKHSVDPAWELLGNMLQLIFLFIIFLGLCVLSKFMCRLRVWMSVSCCISMLCSCDSSGDPLIYLNYAVFLYNTGDKMAATRQLSAYEKKCTAITNGELDSDVRKMSFLFPFSVILYL